MQPSHPLSTPSPPAFNLSQHQRLFQWISSSHQVAKSNGASASASVLQWIFKTDFLYNWLFWSPCRLIGHEFEQAVGVGDGQGGLTCYSSWGRKESDTTERLNWTESWTGLYNLFNNITQLFWYSSRFGDFLFIIFIFWPCHVAWENLVPWPRIEPRLPALEMWSLNHWEVPRLLFKWWVISFIPLVSAFESLKLFKPPPILSKWVLEWIYLHLKERSRK